MPGDKRTRSLAWKRYKPHELVHYGRAGFTRHSRTRMVLTVSFALSLVSRAFLPPSPADHLRRLDASVGASGPHDFAVRLRAARLAPPKRPPHPAPNVRDDSRDAPL